MSDKDRPITDRDFMHELRRYQRGSVSRRHFLGVTGLGLATAVLASAVPILKPRRAYAAGELGDTLNFTTWPNYFAQENLDAFTADTGVAINVSVFGSNEEMLAKLQAGGTGWDVFVPTNYTISTYKELGIIEALDLARLRNFDESTHEARFIGEAKIDAKLYAVPKDWGTTGYVVNTAKVTAPMASWKDFWDQARGDLTGRVMVHDYQLTTIGNALKYYGYSFNSVDPAELKQAEELLIKSKPHLFAINSDYQPGMRATDAWMTMCWTNDGAQLNRDMPEIAFVLGSDGGEIWSDFYAIPTSAANKPAGYALLDYLMTPENAAKEHIANGTPTTDSRVLALLPAELTGNKIVYPDEAALTKLEFGAAVTLTDPARAEVMARFKSA